MSEKQLSHEETSWLSRAFPLILACNDWQDPRNVGMAFRLADAFGLEAIWLGGTTPAPPNRKLKKTARSTERWFPYLEQPDLLAALRQGKADGYRLIGVEITDRSTAIHDYLEKEKIAPTILVLGAEQDGIAPEILAVLDHCVHIPMHGRNSSLNVATALAIALYAFSNSYQFGGSAT